MTVLFVKLQWMGISDSAEMDANQFAFLITLNVVNVSK